MPEAKFIVITPARNEENYIGQTIKSIISQTILPSQWVIVDDGSIDQTATIAESAAQATAWIKVVSRKDRGYRNLDFGMVEAFYYGLSHVNKDDYDFIFLIDADVILGPDYFNAILSKFYENPDLGIAGGVVYECINGKLFKQRLMPWSTTGAVKGWRRHCFREIGGLVQGPGWDSVDIFEAMMLGWQTKTFPDEELKIIHLRPMGSSDSNILRSMIRYGRAAYFIGIHPIYLLASAFYHMLDYPYIIGSLCTITGYFQALLQKTERYNNKFFMQYFSKWQLCKLSSIMRSWCLKL